MDDIIQRLVDVDKQSAKRVEDAKARKLAAKTNLKEKKQQLYDSFIQEQQSIIEEHKTNLLAMNQKKAKEQEEVYKKTLQSLKQNFDQNKDEWIKQIVERCIK